MGPGILWNLTEYVRRLGGARQDAPPVAYNVQPVLVAGDASALTTPLLPPIAWVGGTFTSNNILGATIEVASRGAGGCFIRAFRCANLLASLTLAFGIRTDAAVAITAPVEYTPSNMGPENIRSTTKSGSATPFATPGIRPQLSVNGASNQVVLDDLIYVPPGGWCYFTTGIAATRTLSFAVLIQDVPIPIPVP